MRKLFAAFAATFLLVCGVHGDLRGDMLLIESKLYPSIILYDKEIDGKLIDGAVLISIISQDEKSESAIKFSELVGKNFHGKLKEYPIKTQIISLKEAENSKESAIFVCCECHQSSSLERILAKKSVISFACNEGGLKSGATIGIKVEKSVKPIINKKSLIKSGIKLDSRFLGFADVYEE